MTQMVTGCRGNIAKAGLGVVVVQAPEVIIAVTGSHVDTGDIPLVDLGVDLVVVLIRAGLVQGAEIVIVIDVAVVTQEVAQETGRVESIKDQSTSEGGGALALDQKEAVGIPSHDQQEAARIETTVAEDRQKIEKRKKWKKKKKKLNPLHPLQSNRK